MKKYGLLVFILLFETLHAQVSRVDTLNTPNPFKAISTLVRNYNEDYNIIMSYGERPNLALPLDTVKAQSYFYIENINTGDITKIFALPGGYKVNDIQFVTLRKVGSDATVDYCFFCGTQTRINSYWSISLDGQPSYLVLEPYTHGFVGFFKMDDAISPTTGYFAKVRNIEQTKELWRMACYTEGFGHYYPYQSAYKDNIVADIIGVPDTTNAPSCFCRVKCYPDYNGTTKWDNNMRLNINSLEVMRDIVATEDYVVTVSENLGFNDTIRLRYNDKETHLHSGGLQLRNTYYQVRLSTTYLWGSFIPGMRFKAPLKLCALPENQFAMAFQSRIVDGLYTYRYGLSNFLGLINGTYEKGVHKLQDLIYMPQSQKIAALMEGESYPQMTSLTPYSFSIGFGLLTNVLYHDQYYLQSLYPYQKNGEEYLLWGGIDRSELPNTCVARQRLVSEEDLMTSCFYYGSDEAASVDIMQFEQISPFPIFTRYVDNQIKYPVRDIPFLPVLVEKDATCEIE